MVVHMPEKIIHSQPETLSWSYWCESAGRGQILHIDYVDKQQLKTWWIAWCALLYCYVLDMGEYSDETEIEGKSIFPGLYIKCQCQAKLRY